MNYASPINFAAIRPEFVSSIDAETIDAPDYIPAGGCHGGDAPVYTGQIRVLRDGAISQSEIDAFGALFA